MATNYKIFFSNVREEALQEAKKLPITLDRAGFIFEDDTNGEKIENTVCAVQIIGKKYATTNSGLSVSEEHFNLVKSNVNKNNQYKSFIWLPAAVDYSDADKKQLEFINRLENYLTNNMILSRAESAVQFVEDIRLLLTQEPKKKFDTLPTDVFIISNQVDEEDVTKIQKMLSDIIKMVKLTIVQDSDVDYEEYASQQMNVSKLSVIYYKKGFNWALPFAQQIWKKTGGASSSTTILLIGDLNNPDNEGKCFNAPKVISASVPYDLIPLEIKVQFDNLNENN